MSNQPNREPADEAIVRRADLDSDQDCRAIVAMIDAYSRDPMGADGPLPDAIRERLIPGLREHPTTLVFLAFEPHGADGSHEGPPIGAAVCFLGFSTFAARQLINVHDLSVVPEARGRGVGRRLLGAVEAEGRRRGCCKLTLEVLENNRARRLYEACGFEQAEYTGKAGGALFMMKGLGA